LGRGFLGDELERILGSESPGIDVDGSLELAFTRSIRERWVGSFARFGHDNDFGSFVAVF
jgi:hypothetical protein